MKVIEYKPLTSFNGTVETPSYINNGEYFFDGSTYIAIVEDSNTNITSNTNTLSLDDLKTRMKSLSGTEYALKNDSGVILDSDGIIELVDAWWTTNGL